jgi:hypothetical protein
VFLPGNRTYNTVDTHIGNINVLAQCTSPVLRNKIPKFHNTVIIIKANLVEL